MSEREKIIQYLETEFREPVRDPVWKHIYLAKSHEQLVSTPVFQGLHDIKQLGPAFLVYPGATHTRFSHSLGTFHIAKRIIRGLVYKTEGISFSLEGVKSFLCAALLHDLGHYPFAHALKNLGLLEHETITGQLLCAPPLAGLLRAELEVEPEFVAAIVDTRLEVPAGSEIHSLRRLLSGVLDPDKLDYLNRDAYFCGVPYGIQDVDFFLGEIVADKNNGFALTVKGLTAVENILFSKYLMYKTVYWHKTVRIATAMIKKAILLALRDGIISAAGLYQLTDSAFLRMLSGISYPPLTLVSDVFGRRLYKQVFRVPFARSNPDHQRLSDEKNCLAHESAIARELSSLTGRRVEECDVIIDIPEQITFEIDLPIVSESGTLAFSQTTNIFSQTPVKSLGESLRSVSLIVRRDDALLAAAEKLCTARDPFSA
jgi:HD superfamily phosphohydrolase